MNPIHLGTHILVQSKLEFNPVGGWVVLAAAGDDGSIDRHCRATVRDDKLVSVEWWYSQSNPWGCN